jgi:hypothetical protein
MKSVGKPIGLMTPEHATRAVIQSASEDPAVGNSWKLLAQELWDSYEPPPPRLGIDDDPHDVRVIVVAQRLAKLLKSEWRLPPGLGRWSRPARRMRKLFKQVDYFVVALAVLTSIGKEHSEIAGERH